MGAASPQEIVEALAFLLRTSAVLGYMVGGAICFRIFVPGGIPDLMHARADMIRAKKGLETNRQKEVLINNA